MCSIGGALLHGVKSTPMYKASMLENVTVANKIVHQSVGGSIATALRDHRQSCVMPIQPNRSLPVHPAPHHTHCRSNNIVKTPSSLVRTAGFISASAPSSLSSESEGIFVGVEEASFIREEEKKCVELREIKDSSILDSREDNKLEKKKEEGGTDKEELKNNNARIEEIENGLIEGLNDLSRKRRHSDWRKKIMWNRENRMENDLIDITRSPERIVDLSSDLQSDEPSFFSPKHTGSLSACCYVEEIGLKHKKKHRRRTKKHPSESSTDDFHLLQNHSSKTVPPLRLKKIQNLRDLQTSICQQSDELVDSQFRFDDATIVFQNNNQNFRDVRNFDNPGKYRIVTGHTPPYDEPTESSNVTQSDIHTLDAAKLKYKKSKLVLKLGQLKTKTIELGNEMLRTVLSSPNGPHTKKEVQIRQKLNRYKTQIGNLEKLLSELPEVASDSEEKGEIECRPDVPARQIEDLENVCTSTRFGCSSNSSSRRSSPSLEPPKLSPKFPTYYESSRSPSELRNSPPILPPAYVTLTDCMDDSCNGRNISIRRDRGSKQRSISESMKNYKKSIYSSPKPEVMNQEIMKNHQDEILDLNDDKINSESNLATSTCLDENNVEDILSNSSMDVMEIYEDCAIETKDDPVENIEILEPIVKRSLSPIPIDKTSLDSEETKPIELRIIDESTDTLYENDNSEEETKEKSVKDVAIEEVVDETSLNDIPICEKFPTLANWIATWTKKQIINDEAKLPEVPVVLEQPSAFQVINSEPVKAIAQDVQQKPTRASVTENPGTEGWRNESWQEPPTQGHQQQQQQQQQQPLLQTYSTPNVPLPHSQPPPPLTQDVCSPIAMAGFYARNYLDHYSMAYSYNPTIAAAASLWNSAAILQYPLMRPATPALLNSTQPPRISSGNVQFPGNGGIAQRGSYRVGIQHQNEAKRMKLDGNSLSYVHRDAGIKLHGNVISSSIESTRRSSEFQHAAGQPRISMNPGNNEVTNYRNSLQHPQDQFGRATAYGNSRLPVSSAAWRAGHFLGPIAPEYNYATINAWPTNNPANILNPRNSNSAPSFVPPPNVLSSNLSRSRIPKVNADSNFRNCATPNLGKVRSSPSSVGNYECSNCGRAGPMFKCLGCEVAFYCDKNCQACHWSRHVKSCPKKMPELKKVVH